MVGKNRPEQKKKQKKTPLENSKLLQKKTTTTTTKVKKLQNTFQSLVTSSGQFLWIEKCAFDVIVYIYISSFS